MRRRRASSARRWWRTGRRSACCAGGRARAPDPRLQPAVVALAGGGRPGAAPRADDRPARAHAAREHPDQRRDHRRPVRHQRRPEPARATSCRWAARCASTSTSSSVRAKPATPARAGPVGRPHGERYRGGHAPGGPRAGLRPVLHDEGHITVDSRPGQGTRFTLYLPSLPDDRGAPEARAGLERVMGSGETLLVVAWVWRSR